MKRIILPLFALFTLVLISATLHTQKSDLPASAVYFKKQRFFLNIQTAQHPDSVIAAVAKAMKVDPQLIVEVQGHCSSDERDPQVLSAKRADEVKDRLKAKGIASSRIIATGYSTDGQEISDADIKKLTMPREIENAHSKNRRVTFALAKNDPDDVLQYKDKVKIKPIIGSDDDARE